MRDKRAAALRNPHSGELARSTERYCGGRASCAAFEAGAAREARLVYPVHPVNPVKKFVPNRVSGPPGC